METIWRTFRGGGGAGTSAGPDGVRPGLSSVTVVLPGGERVVAVEALLAARMPPLMEFPRSAEGEIDLTESRLEAFAIKAVLGDAHCENPEEVCEEFIDGGPTAIAGLKAVLHAADYCGAARLKSWIERKLIDTHVNDTDHRIAANLAIEAHNRSAKRLLAATQDVLYSAPKEILKDVPSEILAETLVHIRERTKRFKRTTLAVFGDDGYADGRLIVKEVNIRNGNSGDTIETVVGVNCGTVLDICVSPDGTTVASGHSSGLIKVWKVNSWDARTIFNGRDADGTVLIVEELACSCNGILGALFDRNIIMLWGIESGRCLYKREISGPICPVFSNDGHHFACMSLDDDDRRVINVIDCNTKQHVGNIQENHASLGVDDIRIVTFCGSLLAVGSRTGVDLLDIQDFQSITRVHSFRGHTDRVTAIVANTDGTRLASSSADGTVRVWCVTTESCLHVFQGHEDAVAYLTFLQDDITLAAVIFGGAARFWDTAVGDLSSTVLTANWSSRGVIPSMVIF